MAYDRATAPDYLVTRIARLVTLEMADRLAPLGLRPGTLPVMLELWADDGLTQRDLVQRLGVEQATIANTLKRMERDGLIRRIPDPADGRQQRVHLTETGAGLRKPAIATMDKLNRRALKPLKKKERKTLTALLRKTLAGLDGA